MKNLAQAVLDVRESQNELQSAIENIDDTKCALMITSNVRRMVQALARTRMLGGRTTIVCENLSSAVTHTLNALLVHPHCDAHLIQRALRKVQRISFAQNDEIDLLDIVFSHHLLPSTHTESTLIPSSKEKSELATG